MCWSSPRTAPTGRLSNMKHVLYLAIFLFVSNSSMSAIGSSKTRISSGGGNLTAIASFTAGTTRADSQTGVGFNFTPAANMTVRSLARWVISGNSGTHTVTLYCCASGASGTILGSVSINTSGATTGAFDFVTLGTPVSLTAGTEYYLMSAEGGDTWYDETAFVFSTPSDFSSSGSEFINGGAGFTQNTAGLHTFVGLNFQYTKP